MSVTLNDLREPITVTLFNGKTYNVKPLDGYGFQLARQAADTESVELMYKVAARCLAPALSWDEVFGSDEVDGLTPEDVKLVAEAAQKHITRVEATVPNGSGATAKRGRKAPPSPESRQQTR